MTRVNIVGFETGSLDEIPYTQGATYLSVQNSITKDSEYALRAYVTVGANNTYAAIGAYDADGQPGGVSVTSMHISFAFQYHEKAAANHEQIFQAINVSSQEMASIGLNSAGNLVVEDWNWVNIHTGASVLQVDTWYAIDFYFEKGAAGNWELYLDGNLEGSGTADFHPDNIRLFAFGKPRNSHGNTVEYFYDNIILDDADFATGYVVIDLLPISGAAAYNGWTTGTSSDYTAVADIPTDDDTTYLGTSTALARHSVVHETCSSRGLTVSDTLGSVKAWARARRDTNPGTARVALKNGAGGVSATASNCNLAATYLSLFNMYPVEPITTDAWTIAKIDAAEPLVMSEVAGIEKRCTNLGLMLDYLPAGVVNITVDLDLETVTAEQLEATNEISYTLGMDTQTLTGLIFSPTVHTQAVEDLGYVVYKSYTRLSCSCSEGRTAANSVVICLDPTKTENGAPFIEGWVDSYFCTTDACGQTLYNYTLSYNPHQLLDPESTLYSIDISAVFCRGCLTKYIDWKAPFIQSQANGYILQLPAGFPSPGQVLGVLAIEGNVIVLDWVGGGN